MIVYNKLSNDKSSHEHFDHYYNNIKVDGGGYNFHYEDGKLVLAHGNFIKVENLNTNPSLNPNLAIRYFAEYKNIPYEILTKPVAELMIKSIKQELATEIIEDIYLVYKIVLNTTHEKDDQIGYVDAHTGKILITTPNLIGVSSTGTLSTLYSGSKQATTDYYNNTYNLNDPTRGSGIHTWNINGSSSPSNKSELTDNVNGYVQLRTQMIAAAESNDLFGDNSYQTIQVQNAWYAVGLGTEPTDVTLSTNGSICYSGSTVTASNCPSGSTISWTTSSNLTVQSGGTTTTPTIRAINTSVSGLGTVQIHFTSNDYTAAGPVLEVWVGKPDIPITSPSGYPTIQLNSGAMLNVSLSNTPGAGSASGSWWSTGSIDNIGSSGASCMFEATGTGIGNFYVTTTNDCGTSVAGGGTVNVSGGGGMLMVFPNPATESFEIQLDESVATSNEKEIESELRIYDQYNSLKEIRTFRGKKYKIYTNRLTKGLYLIEVVNKNGKFTTKVIVNKK